MDYRPIIPRDLPPATVEVGAEEPTSVSGKGTLVLTALLAAVGIAYVVKTDVSSQREWSERYGGKR